ncbi:hypothetical protein BESB_044340 [Besnoitia besnoiti]|uniref:Uncharacterized protein n=1 Tax=Besnoitia besnoiti TaxID=94643 RepID=A0A2A9MLC1_BESBE|nr:hypothetical protein BESB_044340 [Besnoitia besnoiti]PFH36242.1 hypothetical protein BESB_044340 [Besnoitia besnoiti]
MGAAASSPGGDARKRAAEDSRASAAHPLDLFSSSGAVVDVPASSSGVQHVLILGKDFVNHYAVNSPVSQSPPFLPLQAPPQSEARGRGESSAAVIASSPPAPDSAAAAREGDSLLGAGAEGRSTEVALPPALHAVQQKNALLADMRDHLKTALAEQIAALKLGMANCPLTAAAVASASATTTAALRDPGAGAAGADMQPLKPSCAHPQLQVLRCYQRLRAARERDSDALACRNAIADLRACSDERTQLGDHAWA